MNDIPLSLYVHLPWCAKKCPYCDFNSHTAGDAPQTRRYVDALKRDLEAEARRADGRTIETVFLGGGTPSLFAPDEIASLLGAVRQQLELSPDAEVTMEANPGTVECGAPSGYRDAGVNRLSLGAQSFDDSRLAILGRIHSSDDIRRAFDEARAGGFDNINLDLMHGLPGQSVEMALADLAAAVELGPEHVSWYQLTLEPNTVFYARPPANLPDDDKAWDIQQKGLAYLDTQAYGQYEVSAYARQGRQCRHNLNYWLFGDYLAIGAGAHGKVTSGDAILRYRKAANPLQYMRAMEAGEGGIVEEPVDRPARLFEFMLNALRLSAGFEDTTFASRTGLEPAVLQQAAAAAMEKGLIRRDARHWQPTSLGRRFLNDLAAEFLEAS